MNLFTVIYKKELVFKYINHLIKEEDITYRQLDVHILHDSVVVEAEMEVRLFVEVAHALHVHHLEVKLYGLNVKKVTCQFCQPAGIGPQLLRYCQPV